MDFAEDILNVERGPFQQSADRSTRVVSAALFRTGSDAGEFEMERRLKEDRAELRLAHLRFQFESAGDEGRWMFHDRSLLAEVKLGDSGAPETDESVGKIGTTLVLIAARAHQKSAPQFADVAIGTQNFSLFLQPPPGELQLIFPLEHHRVIQSLPQKVQLYLLGEALRLAARLA